MAKPIHTNEYLYGTHDVPSFPSDIINMRLELLNESLAKVMGEPYMKRDFKRANAIMKAIDWHEAINDV